MKRKKEKGKPASKSSFATTNNNSSLKKYFGDILLAVCTVIVIQGMIKYIDGYHWLHNIMLAENRDTEKLFTDSTMQTRLKGRIGFSYSYLNFINKNSPEDAIIAMPLNTEFFPAGAESHFDKNITTLGWASYFVYPRRLVASEEPHGVLYKKATHMAFVNKYGYERLPYKIDFPYRYAVLPVKTQKKKL